MPDISSGLLDLELRRWEDRPGQYLLLRYSGSRPTRYLAMPVNADQAQALRDFMDLTYVPGTFHELGEVKP